MKFANRIPAPKQSGSLKSMRRLDFPPIASPERETREPLRSPWRIAVGSRCLSFFGTAGLPQ
jgi:hypothetical protein